MSDEVKDDALATHRPTIASLLKRQDAETEIGVAVDFYEIDHENDPAYFIGTVWVNNDPKALEKKLEGLKAKKGRRKEYVWSDAELEPLRELALCGTLYRKIVGFLDETGAPMESTEANILKILQINSVRRKCTNILNDEATWEALAKEELAKN